MASPQILQGIQNPRIANIPAARAARQANERVGIAFEQQQEDRARAQQVRGIQGQMVGQRFAEGSQQRQFAELDPIAATATFEALGVPLTSVGLQTKFARGLQVADALGQGGDVEGAKKAIQDIGAEFERNGLKTERIDAMLKDAQKSPDLIPAMLAGFKASGLLDDKTGRNTLAQVQSSKILPDGTSVQVFRNGSTQVTDARGNVLAGDERVAAVKKAQEFGIDVQAGRAGARAGATGVEKRASALIDRGLAAAESTATIRRAITLLDNVETGGISAISLAVQRKLGIEGADEGELSNSLGKSVLSQLRETFGAAFTESEGARLERIEAGFGKSSATNKRLLQQALRIAERTSQRAIKAAKERGFDSEVADIEDLLTFTLDIQPEITRTGGDQGETAPGATDQPAAAPAAAAAAAQEVTTQAEFDALPTGALFIENGQEFRKP